MIIFGTVVTMIIIYFINVKVNIISFYINKSFNAL